MASEKREFGLGEFYHIYDRGNHLENVFQDRRDRVYFLSKLDEYAERDQVTVVAYCLMTNHYHLLLRQDSDIPISHMMMSLKTGYVRAYNLKYGLVGRLFQARYGIRRIRDTEDLMNISRYIHMNPDVFSDPRSYEWSSLRQYIGNKIGICEPTSVLELFSDKDSYTTFLNESVSRGEPVAVTV